MTATPEASAEFNISENFEEMRPHHNCGVVAVSLDPESTANSAFVSTALLTHLQHRGPDGAGVAAYDIKSGESLGTSNVGKVANVLTRSNLMGINGEYSIGQVRYPTQGASGKMSLDALQPIYYSRPNSKANFWIGHNGQ